MILIQRKARIPLMVKDQIAEAFANRVAARTVDLGRRSKLADVRVLMTSLAAGVGHGAEGSAWRIDEIAFFVTAVTLSSSVGPRQFVSGPSSVTEAFLPKLVESLCQVASGATFSTVDGNRQSRLIETADVYVRVAGAARQGSVVEKSQSGHLAIWPGALLGERVTVVAAYRGMGSGQRESRLAMLFNGKRRRTKRGVIVAHKAVSAAERALLELAVMGIAMATPARRGRAAKDPRNGRLRFPTPRIGWHPMACVAVDRSVRSG